MQILFRCLNPFVYPRLCAAAADLGCLDHAYFFTETHRYAQEDMDDVHSVQPSFFTMLHERSNAIELGRLILLSTGAAVYNAAADRFSVCVQVDKQSNFSTACCLQECTKLWAGRNIRL